MMFTQPPAPPPPRIDSRDARIRWIGPFAVTAAFALCFLAKSATADDISASAPFKGFYAGVHGSYDTGEYSGQLLDFNDCYAAPGNCDSINIPTSTQAPGLNDLQRRALIRETTEFVRGLGLYFPRDSVERVGNQLVIDEDNGEPFDGVEGEDLDGFGFGIHFGYLIPLGERVRFGLEANATFGGPDAVERTDFQVAYIDPANARRTVTRIQITEENGPAIMALRENPDIETFENYREIQTDVSYYASLRGRLGWVFDIGYADISLMPYLHGGVAVVDIESAQEVYQLQGNQPGRELEVPIGTVVRTKRTELVGGSEQKVGYALGGGLELEFAGNWFVRAEYTYHDFGDMDWRYVGLTDPANSADFLDFGIRESNDGFEVDKFDIHSLTIGIGVRF